MFRQQQRDPIHPFNIHDRVNDIEMGFNEGEPPVLAQPAGTSFEVSTDGPEVTQRGSEDYGIDNSLPVGLKPSNNHFLIGDGRDI